MRFARLLAVSAVIGAMVFPVVDRARAGAVDSPPVVTVSGDQLLRNGMPWTPKGLTLIGVLSPDGTGLAGTAATHLGPGEMAAAAAWGVDALRFQVSQRGLDPTDSLYSTAYVDQVRAAVDLAES